MGPWASVLSELLLYGSYTAERRQLLLRHSLGQYSINALDLRGARLETQLAQFRLIFCQCLQSLDECR